MVPRIVPLEQIISTCYVISERGTIMIDAGPPGRVDALRTLLSKRGVSPAAIRLIVLTHCHFDHVGSARDVRLLTGASIAIHQADRSGIEYANYGFPPGTTTWGWVVRTVLERVMRKRGVFPAVNPDIVLTDEDFPLQAFGIDGCVVHTPGHTPGSVSVVLESGEAFVGCLAHNGFPFHLRPGLPIFAEDIEQVKKSWTRILQRGAKTIYPAHGKPFPVDVVKRFLH